MSFRLRQWFESNTRLAVCGAQDGVPLDDGAVTPRGLIGVTHHLECLEMKKLNKQNTNSRTRLASKHSRKNSDCQNEPLPGNRWYKSSKEILPELKRLTSVCPLVRGVANHSLRNANEVTLKTASKPLIKI